MKKFTVTLSHIVGYYKDEDNTPKLKLTEVEVIAENEAAAIRKATDEDKTHWSVWESYADEVELKYTVGQKVSCTLGGTILYSGVITKAEFTESEKPYTIISDDGKEFYAHEEYLTLSN